MYAPKLPSPACPVLPSGQLTLPGSRVVPALGEMDAVPDVSPPHATNRRHPAVIPQRIRMNRSILIRLCLGRILARPDAVASSPEDHNRGQTRGDPRARLATVLATVALDKTSLSEAQGLARPYICVGAGESLGPVLLSITTSDHQPGSPYAAYPPPSQSCAASQCVSRQTS